MQKLQNDVRTATAAAAACTSDATATAALTAATDALLLYDSHYTLVMMVMMVYMMERSTCIIDFWGEDGNEFTDEQYTDICENSNKSFHRV